MSICIFTGVHTNVAICSSQHNIYIRGILVCPFSILLYTLKITKYRYNTRSSILVNNLRNNVRVLFDNVIHFLARNRFLPKLCVYQGLVAQKPVSSTLG